MIGRFAVAAALVVCAVSIAWDKLPHPSFGHVQAQAAQVTLAVPHIRQEANLCVPTSAAMILSYYGDPESPRMLKALSANKPYDPKLPFTDFTMTYYRDIVAGMSRLGYAWSEETYPNTPDGFARGRDRIKAELSSGHPVMVDLTLPSGDGHTIVVSGFSDASNKFYIVDPDHAAPGTATISYSDFAGVWNEHAYGGDFRGLVITQPHQQANAGPRHFIVVGIVKPNVPARAWARYGPDFGQQPSLF